MPFIAVRNKKNNKWALRKKGGSFHKQGDKIVYYDSEEMANKANKAIMANESGTFKASIDSFFLEASPDGKIWDVVLIEEGFSKNNGENGFPRYYPEETLKKAVKLFEQAPAMAYKFIGRMQDLFDHQPDAVREKGLAGNQVGFFENVRYGEYVNSQGGKSKGILAKFHVLEGADWLRKNLLHAWEKGKQLLGFSIDADGSETPKYHGDQMVDWVESISNIIENTVVTRAAAGGQVIRLVASKQNEETVMNKEQIIKLIQEKAPHLLESKNIEKLTEKECEELLKEALSSAKQIKESTSQIKKLEDRLNLKESNETLRVKLNESELSDEVKTQLLKDNSTKVLKEADITSLIETKQAELKESATKSEKETEIDKKAKELNTRIEKFENNFALRESQLLFKTKVTESNLPEAIKEKLAKQHSDKALKESEVVNLITVEQDAWAKLNESMPKSYTTVKVGSEEKDKLMLAMDGFWEGQNVKDKDGKFVQAFVSFKEAYASVVKDPMAMMAAPEIILSDSYWYMPDLGDDVQFAESYNHKRKKALRESAIREAMISTDWAEILADSLHRKLMKEWSADEYQIWRKITSDIIPINDFRSQKRLKMGGYGTLSTVAEQATYLALTSPTDTEITYTPTKKGGLESITIEMVANDDVGAIRKIPVKLGRAAAITLYRAIFDMFKDNQEGDASTTLASTSRGNQTSGATALNDAGMATAILAMREQTVYGDTSDYIGMSFEPAYLLIPAELEPIAKRLHVSNVRIGTTGVGTDADSTEPNIYKGKCEPIILPYWTDAAMWWMIANPAKAPTIEVGFFRGKQEPELFVQDNPTVGSAFTADKITYKIRHIWGYNILDYKALYHGSSS